MAGVACKINTTSIAGGSLLKKDFRKGSLYATFFVTI